MLPNVRVRQAAYWKGIVERMGKMACLDEAARNDLLAFVTAARAGKVEAPEGAPVGSLTMQPMKRPKRDASCR